MLMIAKAGCQRPDFISRRDVKDHVRVLLPGQTPDYGDAALI